MVTGTTLETLILISNSFTGTFFQRFQAQAQNSNTADQLFGEDVFRMYFEMYIEITKLSEKLRYQRIHAKG